MTTHLQSEHIEAGLEARLSRRGLVQALAAGAAANVATPALAEQTAVVAEAASADYVRDPTRWGSAELAVLFPNFKHLDIRTNGQQDSPSLAAPEISTGSWRTVIS
jgi:hypothetical protein